MPQALLPPDQFAPLRHAASSHTVREAWWLAERNGRLAGLCALMTHCDEPGAAEQVL